MDKEKLYLFETKNKLPKGLLNQIIELEEEHQYQLKPRGILVEIENIIADHAQKDLEKQGGRR